MLSNTLILFLTSLFGGLAVYLLPKLTGQQLKMPLVFAGSYLFAVTIIHIMPELFHSTTEGSTIGIMVLLGFFFQYFLEFFTAGVEHGHMHKHTHDHHHSTGSIYMLMIGLSLHAFLEGTLISHPSALHSKHDSSALLLGIILHKMPAAFALMSVLTCEFSKRTIPVVLLVIFSLMSPAGLISGDFIPLSENGVILLFAFVSGNFLHISTTIFIESSPEHSWSLPKVVISVLGALFAIAAEMVF
ncbi:MAG: ZIP family metal transporter [Cyclobacteriaceae bacterium]